MSDDMAANLKNTENAQALGAFSLIEPVARGGMASIWRGVHTASQLPVAVKLLSADHARTTAFRRQFRNEVRAVARLQHPHLVLIYDHGIVGVDHPVLPVGAPYLVMEWASSGTLEDAPAPDDWHDVLGVLVAMLDALGHAHGRGILHRDLKPANLLICGVQDRRPGLKIADFGLAMDLEGGEALFQRSGTPAYMAPEQFLGEWRRYGPPTDLYALGCMAWSWLTGRPLFREVSIGKLAQAHKREPVGPFRPRLSVPDGIEPWLRWLLEKAPEGRPPTAAHALAALRSLGEPGEHELFAPSIPPDGPLQATTWANATASGLSDQDTPTELLLAVTDEVAFTPDVDFDEATEPLRHGAPAVPVRPRQRRATWTSDQILGAGLALFRDRRVPVIGRAREQEQLWSALVAASRERMPRVVHVEGRVEAGIDELADWLAEEAHGLVGAEVWSVSAASGGARGALSAWLRADLQDSALYAHVSLVLHRLGLDDVGLADLVHAALLGRDDPVRALVRVVARFSSANPERVLIVTVRPDTLEEGVGIGRELGQVARLQPLPAVVVLSSELPLPRDLLPLDALVHVPVGPLNPQDCTRLVVELLGLENRLAGQLVRRCGGLPGVAVTLVAELADREDLVLGTSGFALRAGAELALSPDMHASRVRQLDAVLVDSDDRRALDLLVALGEEATLGLWHSACQQAGLSVDPTRLERWLAARLARVHADGRLALADPSMASTLEHLARADDGDGWRSTLEAAVDALQLAGRRAPGSVLRELGRGREAVQALLGEAMGLVQEFRYREARAVVEEARSVLARGDIPADDPLVFDHASVDAYVALNAGEGPDAVARPCELLLSLDGQPGAEVYVGRAHRYLCVATRYGGDLDASGHHARAGMAYYSPDEPGEALQWGICVELLADRARAMGDLEEAERLGNLVLEAGSRHRVRWLEAKGHATVAKVCTRAGRYAEAAQHLRTAVSLTDAHTAQDAVHFRYLLGVALLHDGRVDEADRLFRQIATEGERWLHPTLAASGRIGELMSCVWREDWAAWPRAWARVRRIATASRIADFDVMVDLVDVATLLDEHGRPDLAHTVRLLVRDVTLELGVPMPGARSPLTPPGAGSRPKDRRR